jgi:membrane associated rhomboid family serine protease
MSDPMTPPVRKLVSRILTSFSRTPGTMGFRACPFCSGSMSKLSFAFRGEAVDLDHCDPCRAIWFAKGRLEEARDLLKASHSRSQVAHWDIEKPVPWAALAVFLVCLFFARLPLTVPIARYYVFIHRPGYVTPASAFILSFFTHNGLEHFVDNGIFIILTGLVLETRIGALPYLMLLFWSHLAGIGGYLALHSGQTFGLVGASAGLFGVFGFAIPYSLRTGRAGGLLYYIIFWIISEILFVFAFWGDKVTDGVGHWAHLGGALGGLLFFVVFRKRFPSRP